MGKYLALLLPLLFISCATKTIVEEKLVPEVHYVEKVQKIHDSIFIHDSVYETQYLQGDTIVKYKYQQKVQYKDRLLVDTLVKIDSIPFEVTKTITNEKTNYSGWWAFSILAIVC